MSLRRYLGNITLPLLPPTRLYRLRAYVWRWAGIQVHPTARLVSSVQIWTAGKVSIGEDTFVGHEVLITGGAAPITIGAQVDIAPRVVLVGGSHLQDNHARAAGSSVSSPITVGDGVWIGAGATILGGVSIGSRSIVAAGAVVRSDVPPGSIAVGVPAVCRPRRSVAI